MGFRPKARSRAERATQTLTPNPHTTTPPAGAPSSPPPPALQVGLQLDESLGDGLFGVVKKGSVFLLEGAGVVVFFLVVDVVEQGVFLIHPNGENPISSAAER